jgi:hypothetical protein
MTVEAETRIGERRLISPFFYPIPAVSTKSREP